MLCLLFGGWAHGQQLKLAGGMKINRSATIKKELYRLNGNADTASAVIRVEGNNITIDFNHAELNGSGDPAHPDLFSGVGLRIQDAARVTIRNLRVRGYKTGLLAINVKQLVLENCDFSYNYRPQLNSTQEKEDISDWMSYHHNEKDEWRRYGAGIYLKDCDNFTVRNCRVTGGQNALMLMRCNDGLIEENDFSFNSGIGIGMYRSCRNKVQYNRVIFNVRGYSHGVYNRGQDSAGILVYEQSSQNFFLFNNVTHGGDGFFLWAGQYTMDTGQGGCNENVLFGNDFSFAPTNGIEVTFSSNYIARNRIFECDHGIWGGYSYRTTIRENQFRDNRIGIAIEHGQRNRIEQNLFSGDKTAIRLWSNKLEPSDWGYPKYRDTRSAAYHISLNSFNNNPLVFDLRRSDSLWIHDNSSNGGQANYFKMDSTITRLDSVYDFFDTGSGLSLDTPVTKTINAFQGTGKYRGRKEIRITPWGPYDFRYPLIWLSNPTDSSGILRFEILGPKGTWRVKNSKGVRGLSVLNGSFPSVLTAERISSDKTDIVLELEYTGESFTSRFGETIPAGKRVGFSFKKYFQPLNWELQFFDLDTLLHNPVRTGTLFSPAQNPVPFRSEKKDRIDYAWWGGIKEAGITHPRFITTAGTEGLFDPGDYEISLTWDDAVRVYLDGQLLFNEWEPSRHSFDESPHKKIRVKLSGAHRFRVEHLELGGFACLALKIKPVGY